MTGAPPPPPTPSSWGWEPPSDTPGRPTGTTPAGSGPESSTTKPRKRWIVVLALALALIVVTTVAGTVLFATSTLPPLAATYDFTNDLSDGNTNAAFAQVCDRLRTPASRSGFDGFARQIASGDSVEVNILSVDRNGDVATVDFTTHSDNERSRTLTLKLVHEDGDWRPCGTT